MLEVNDFNAIRISLASPEQIRGWSYGEVIKPETINYRTLKPEKDGLFCERIFGPTKDWECYCGKYKRVRYKGIICDKCGVEVAREKVRRERMGHIELASPVSHIWYFKGTPSRLGLLLDVSPRNLERILYFALYIVTRVHEDERQRAIDKARSDEAERIAEIEHEVNARGEELAAAIQDLEIQRASEIQALEERRQEAINEVMAAGHDLEEAKSRVDQIEAQYLQDMKALESRTTQGTADLQSAADADLAQARAGVVDQVEQVRQETQRTIEEIESIKWMSLLTEAQYRDLKDRFGYLFEAGMGAEAIRDIILQVSLDDLAVELRNEIRNSSQSSQRRKKATKRLRVVESFRKSGQQPDWMILTVLPVIPPNLRPMVQLDGGRFATSDLNDLYRRVINRNNRLKRLIELGAPEIIIRNEKRMLQEATDALIDNGRRGRAVNGSGNHKLKSLSDMLKGKQGRFRQNLLGKRVDYSGRSVIVVGPDLKLNQCGLPKKMALELFKPFVMRKLVERNFAHNIKSAKRIVERVRPEVWDVLEEVIKDHPVLLNRAPTLHRLGIQAFDAVLVEGSAIQIHPLVCTAFNADFDGDQMAVHVPLSRAAQEEARGRMMSTRNLLSPASGEPIVNPTKDMVLGCYYLTMSRDGERGEGTVFSTFDEALQAVELGKISLHARIFVGVPQDMLDEDQIQTSAGLIRRDDLTKLPNSSKAYGLETTAGRIVFNEALPREVPYKNARQDKGTLRDVVAEVYALYGQERTAEVADEIKRLGFDYATHSGITMSVADITIPTAKPEIVRLAEEEVLRVQEQYEEGLITDDERYRKAVDIWTQASQEVEEAVTNSLDPFGPIYMMSVSGAAKGGFTQVRQIAGMRGLMADPSGKIIDLPILSNFREGLSVLEYFISTHGARKGLADTALRTAESGYLTRRLIDVAQDVIIREDDCGTTAGTSLRDTPRGDTILEPVNRRIVGRLLAQPFYDPETGTLIADANEVVDRDLANEIGEALAKDPDASVIVRSPLTCVAKHGLCRSCYGWSLATGRMVELGEAVGIIAAQSIGEPGTQLTMRTFHTGGVAGSDITQGLPRVEELFEARVPKEVAVISEIDGIVHIEHDDNEQRIVVSSTEEEATERHSLGTGYQLAVANGELVQPGTVLARPAKRGRKQEAGEDIVATTAGRVTERGGQIIIAPEPLEVRTYPVSVVARVRVADGQEVTAGTQLTEGAPNPQDILRVMGREVVQLFLVEEVQRVYKTQGVNINDKHIEVIVRQMLRKVRVDTPGDTDLLPGEMVDRFKYEGINAAVLAQGGEPATATTVLLGVTKASLTTDSFLAAASFQDTTKVLTDAAIAGQVDRLVGLKENVIIGKLIPAGTGLLARQRMREALLQEHDLMLAEANGELMGDGHDGADGFDEESVDGDGDLADLAAVGALDQSDIA
ncbi:MAG TPA: DNA-directed RNA polymerase subunit beta' [Chloroflexota bacterium]|nr:DNA-directed RNA polymerase subunit beta' [Chloroflexota bacterium]